MSKILWVYDQIEAFTALQPFWHPLGFVSCLLEGSSSNGLRLHYWPRNERKPKSPNLPIHTHIFDLKSTVIQGSLIDRQYQIFPGNDYCIYEVRYNGIDSAVVPTTKHVSASVCSETRHDAGKSYCIPSDIFHESIVSIDQDTATLAETTAKHEGVPLVLGWGDDGPFEYDRLPFDRKTFWDAIATAIVSNKERR